jgi:hypothetical protein
VKPRIKRRRHAKRRANKAPAPKKRSRPKPKVKGARRPRQKLRAAQPPAPKSVPGPPKRKPGTRPVPELDLHAFEASRNWHLLNADRARKKRARGGEPTDRIGQSKAVRKLLDAAPARSPKLPPPLPDHADEDVFPFHAANLAIPELGYGETLSDELWKKTPGGKLIQAESRYSRRTRTGRRKISRPMNP